MVNNLLGIFFDLKYLKIVRIVLKLSYTINKLKDFVIKV